MTTTPRTGAPDAGTATTAATKGDRAGPPAGDRASTVATGAGALRASDQEREQVIARLHAAVGEGRLSLDEAEERITAVYGMRYREELAPVVDDLPADGESGVAAANTPPPWSRLWEGAVWHGLRALHGHPVPRPTARQSCTAVLTVAAAALLFVVFVVLGVGLGA